MIRLATRKTAIRIAIAVCCLVAIRLFVIPPLLAPLLMDAVHVNDMSLARVFLTLGASATARNRYGAAPLDILAGMRTGPLFTMLQEEDVLKMAELLIRHGADVNNKAQYEVSPLHSAYKEKIARLLVMHGADVRAVTNAGETPLHFRIASGARSNQDEELNTARLLISKGAPVNAMSNNGETPLHKAAYFNNLDGAKLLLSMAGDANAGSGGYAGTPLHSASQNGDYKDMAALLLAHGARVNATNAKGETPLQLGSCPIAWCRSTARTG